MTTPAGQVGSFSLFRPTTLGVILTTLGIPPNGLGVLIQTGALVA
jgi:hypothetical protein